MARETRSPISIAMGHAASSWGLSWFRSRVVGGFLTFALFIPTPKLCTPLVPICGKGDDRSWGNPYSLDCTRARVCAWIDLSDGLAFTKANPSCGLTPGDCRSARPWTHDLDNAAIWGRNGFRVEDHWTYFWSFLDRGDGCTQSWVKSSWSVQQAYYWNVLPSIEGSIAVRRCRRGVELWVTGDGYPDFEMSYYDANSSLRAVLRVKNAGGPQYLLQGPGDWSMRFNVR
jgi:hypothetical protein